MTNHSEKQLTLSVIIPVYNGCEYLKEAIDSLLKQTYPPQEIIIVDDGSTDGSDKLVEKYCEKYKTIKLLRNAHGGVSSARNAGLKIASGDFIYFMDSDDFVGNTLFADFIEQKYSYPDIELFCFSARMFMNAPIRERAFAPSHSRVLRGLYSGGSDFLRELIDNKSAHRVLWTSIISRNLIDRCDNYFLPIQVHEDAPFMFMLYMQANKIWISNNDYYFKRYYESSLSLNTKDFSWVNSYFIARENTEKKICNANMAVDSKLIDDYYYPVMYSCIKMIKKHKIAIPDEYQEATKRMFNKLIRGNPKLWFIWHFYPLYNTLAYCKKNFISTP